MSVAGRRRDRSRECRLHAPFDRAPDRQCAAALTLLIGHHAQAYYLGGLRKATLSDSVKAWREYLPLGYLPLAHPSPRNQPWLVKNPWFEAELVLDLRNVIQALKL